MLEYEIRSWNNKGNRTWSLWRVTYSRQGWFRRWNKCEELLSQYDTEKAAVGAMTEIVKPHYDAVEHYDDKGRRSIMGW